MSEYTVFGCIRTGGRHGVSLREVLDWLTAIQHPEERETAPQAFYGRFLWCCCRTLRNGYDRITVLYARDMANPVNPNFLPTKTGGEGVHETGWSIHTVRTVRGMKESQNSATVVKTIAIVDQSKSF